MKPHRRDKLDHRISRALKAGLLGERPPVLSRVHVLRSAAAGTAPSERLAGWGTRPSWASQSSERSRQRAQLVMQARNYGYIVVTANMRLAW